MSLFQSIIVAADFSDASQEAFRVACSLACEGETHVIVLNVMEPKYEVETPVYFGDQTVHYTRIARSPSEQGAVKEKLQEVYSPDRPLNVTYQTAEGEAAEEVLRYCEETGCDLVVMGTHGRTGLLRLLTGSVAENILRRAKCAVLALRQTGVSGSAFGDRVILHPTDFSKGSQEALRTARALAQARGARLIILHVMPLETVIYGSVPVPYDVQAVRNSLASLATETDGASLKHPVSTRLTQGDAASEIVRIADEEPECGLIVIGTHGRTGLSRLFMGSVAEAVLRKARCPVLMVKMTNSEMSPSS
jgi:nucleotide-binding universal stress UspA family protein